MNWKEILIGLLMLTLVSGCEMLGPSKSNCSWVKPIFIGSEDKLTPSTARSILLHNETWSEICR